MSGHTAGAPSFYTDARKNTLHLIDMKEVVAHLENSFSDHGPLSLRSYSEAVGYYDMILENAGAICADFIAPRAEKVDAQGASFKNGEVEWADATKENMKVLGQAGYMGGTLPRKYGGLNLPVTVNTAIVEMVSQADASLMNLFGLQDIAVTVYKFGSEEQKDRVLPKFCCGEVSGSMALTEPDAGSDLQAVGLKAVEKDGKWYLDGVKRFITNGCGEVSLVLARSEEGTKGGRGLSMFLYERYRDHNMIIRRIEDKLGIHGSPTCELQFNMAECELVGKRKFGLIKYVMDLMNGARLAVSAQALGIAQAAWNEAAKYASEREQFGKKISEFPAVYQMLDNMKVQIETTRLLLYVTAFAVDEKDMLDKESEQSNDLKQKMKEADTRAGFLTPLTKFTATEMANKVTYDAIQIHGGCGYMKDFPVERYARDARITNIYEGTTQLQVVAAIGGITSGFFGKELSKLLGKEGINPALKEELEAIAALFSESVEEVKATGNKEYLDYVAGYFVECASIIYRMALLLEASSKNDFFNELVMPFKIELETRVPYLCNLSLSWKKRFVEKESAES